MKINFRDKKVRELCERSAVAAKKLGDANARKLQTRLSELESARCVSGLFNGRPHPLKGDRAGHFSVDLAGGYRLVFSPDHEPCPVKVDGGIDWTSVTIVCIEYIGDYHD
ncbi:MAG: killer suppression protein HigA [Pseudomonas sp.]|uniref:type II toxin-antitoxin system RelE/ParE family toxin n=1 Tax=Pseudomonas sp. TaxID=306 RepID=UPI001D62F938|nr:killer suppression protein HigA [Pseudomonas sp.]MPS98576.1 killer suppression protein HigA [Pseudomonas sp.]